VFTRAGSSWTQQGGRLLGTGTSGEARQGAGVALSADGNTALIGGPEDNERVGAAWVFTRSGTSWSQQGEKLTATGEIGKGTFGEAVALSSDGNTALLGGWEDDSRVGAAWVFTRSGSSWTQQGEKLTGAGEVGPAQFGMRVALSGDGDTALIGGPEDNGRIGGAWVFTRTGSTWAQQGEKLRGANEVSGSGGRFGADVALSTDGTTAIVGGPWDRASSRALHASGAAWIFADVALSAPELGRCVAVAAATGQYENGTCTKAGGTRKYVWFPAVGKAHFTIKLKALTEAKLITAGTRTIACTGLAGAGEYEGQKALANVALALTGCHLGTAGACQSVEAAEGEVVTASLRGELGVITTSPEGPTKNKIGIDLAPASGEVLAAFACGGTSVLVTGSVIAEVPANSMKSSATLSLVASSKGVQKTTRFEGGEEDVLRTRLGDEAPFEQSGLNLKAVQTNEEKVEINPVL
jgi:hypothetical protein